MCISKISKALISFGITVFTLTAVVFASPQIASAYTISNNYFNIETGSYGQISSLKLTNDMFPTNYVMNTSNAPKQNTGGHQWLGELMFKYKLGSGSWTTANTNKSDDARKITQNGNKVTVTYQNSGNADGIRNFKVQEDYSLEKDYLLWSINVSNTSSQTLTIGDFGVPLAFNEFWSGEDAIYETRTVDHSFTGNNSSYIYVTRPSGLGNYLLMVPDSSTGAGFEYQDHWRAEERSGEETAWCQDQSGWANGLNVFYIHSNVIKSTNRGYLPNTSLTLAPGESRTYSFKFFSVANEAAMKQKLYDEGLIDVNVVPGMMFATNMTAKVDLHTSKTINSIDVPSGATMTYKTTTGTNHKIYELTLTKLGQNNVTINYDNGKKTVLQFYAIQPVETAIQSRATHMVNYEQINSNDFRNKVFDDWMLNTQSTRNSFDGYWGWGDDWGLTHGEFLAEKNVVAPVTSEIKAVDDYLETAIWNSLMKQHHDDYYVHDFLMYKPGDVSGECKNSSCGNNTPMGRGYAYPHIYNTYFSMYKIARLYPNLVSYKNDAKTYLYRAYRIMKTLYDGSVAYNWNTGLMGELTTPEIIQALKDEGYTTEANDLTSKMATKYNNFKNTTYPYGSEYSYDNTGEEAVYTLAKMNSNSTMMSKINSKTRACRGNQPVWYYYADPVSICGENWWNFQYTTSLAGYCMDDWMRYKSTTPELDARMTYAAKLANIGCINNGSISSASANIGAASWTYQAEKGNLGGQGVGNGTLHNGWRDMTGEADLGLFGALKILSADVAVDPIFGLYGYGCDVTENSGKYVITPKDGLSKRLNLITEKLYIELNRDQYTSATVAAARNYVELSLKNQFTNAAHTTKLSIYNLLSGNYDVLVNDVKVGSFKATAGKQSVASLNIGTNESYNIKVKANGDPTIEPNNVALSGTPSTSFCSSWESINAINDGYDPANSADKSNTVYGNWDNSSSTQWVQYDFSKNYTISKCDVYWFKDGGGIDVPASCSIQYWDGSNWVNVQNPVGLGLEADKYNTTTFTPVSTNKIRLNMTAKANSWTGVIEWKVWESTGVTNTAPKVEAGADNTVTLPSKISLIGTATDDGLPAGSKLTTAWSLQSGSGSAEIANTAALSTTVAVSAPGTYVFKLTASDGALSTSDTVTITVKQASTQYVYGDADGDGNVNAIDLAKMKKYLLGDTQAVTSKDWNITGDLNVDGVINALDFGILKQYVLGKIDKLPIKQEKSNAAPVAEAGADSSCTLPANIILNGTASDDGLPSGSKLATTWSLQSGPGTAAISNANALNTTATVTTAGTYVFKLTATDGTLSSSDTVAVTVIKNNSEEYVWNYGNVPSATKQTWSDNPSLTPININPYGNPSLTIPYGYILLSEGPNGTSQVSKDKQTSILKRINEDLKWETETMGIQMPPWSTGKTGTKYIDYFFTNTGLPSDPGATGDQAWEGSYPFVESDSNGMSDGNRYNITHEFNHALLNAYGTVPGNSVSWIQESLNDYMILRLAEWRSGATAGQSKQFPFPSGIGYLDAEVFKQPFVPIESCGVNSSGEATGPSDYFNDSTGFRYNELFPLFVSQRVGMTFYAKVFEEAKTSEQNLQTMTRLLDKERVQSVVTEYAARLALGDFMEFSQSVQELASTSMYAATTNQNGWLVPSDRNKLPRYTGRNIIPISVSSEATQVTVNFAPDSQGSNGTTADMRAQIAYRATDGTTVFSTPVSTGKTTVKLAKAPKNGVVTVVISNVTMDGYKNADSYGWDPTEKFGYKIQVTGGTAASTDRLYF